MWTHSTDHSSGLPPEQDTQGGHHLGLPQQLPEQVPLLWTGIFPVSNLSLPWHNSRLLPLILYQEMELCPLLSSSGVAGEASSPTPFNSMFILAEFPASATAAVRAARLHLFLG